MSGSVAIKSVAIEIRPAHVAEADAIATLHAKVWRDTYLDVAPAEALAKLNAAHRLKGWQTYLTSPSFTATRSGRCEGWGGHGLYCLWATDPTRIRAHGEVKHLYVDPACMRQRIGQQLMQSAFKQMAQDGFARAALAVVQSNESARAFYAKMRGVEVGHFIDAGPLWKSKNLIIAWDIRA